MRQTMSYQIRILTRWVCVLTVMCSQFGLFTLRAAAQEPTTEPTSLPTPTPAPTWTATPTPTNTPDPAVTPTANPTVAARLVDFRVDEDEIVEGECVIFSWVVRGDIDRVEFDQVGDSKVPLLVSDMDSRDECPEEDTKYKLVVTWLDSTQTTRSIEVEVDVGGSSSGDNGSGTGTPTPGGTAAFVPVTPIPIATTPVSVSYTTPAPVSSGGAVVTPVGVLASVQVLPDTGHHLSPSPYQKTDGTKDDLPNRRYWWPLAGGLVLILAVAVVCFTLRVRALRTSEVSR